MRFRPALALPLVLAAVGAAQEPAPSPSELWHDFVAAHGDQWTVRWNKATGTPRSILGVGIPVADGPVASLDDARRLGAAALERFSGLLGRGESTFVESIAAKVNRTFVLVYDQRFRGLPVIGGRADLRIHDVGRLSMLGSDAVPVPAGFDVHPAVDPELARGVAHEHLGVALPGLPGELAKLDKPRLVVWARTEGTAPTPVRLAFEVRVDARPAQVIVGDVFVDALTGTVLEHVDRVYHCALGHAHVRGEDSASCGEDNASRAADCAGAQSAAREAIPVDVTGNLAAYTNIGLSPLSPLSNIPLRNLLVSIDGGGSAYTDASGNFTIPHGGTAPVTLRVTFDAGRSRHLAGGMAPQQGTALVTTAPATPGVPANLQLLTATAVEFDRSQTTTYWGVDDVNEWVRGILGNLPQMNTISNVRATVNRASTCNAFYSANSINFYATGGGCNMTAYSTVVYHEWGHGLDDSFGGISQVDGLSEGWGDICAIYRSGQPIVGQDFTTTGGIVRDARNTRTYPAGGGVHQQGETWMGFAWDLRNNLIASLGPVAGPARAEQIVIGSIVANATNQPTAVEQVFVADDDDGNLGNGTPNYAALQAAAVRRNLPFPVLQVGTITHTALTSTTLQLSPRVVRASVQVLQGAFNRVELVYDAGQGSQRRDLVPSGVGNEMVALLPGVLSPQVVRYHLEGLHSTGVTIRVPVSGDFSYAVGNETVLFQDNFDGATSAWTHALLRNQDDWHNEPARGLSGDAPAAFSAPNVWGNDLGRSGWNGLYQDNTTNYLRSPTLDMTGRTGVTLRFMRWLTVEAGQFDQAQVLVNGNVVWQNPTGTDLIDTSWVETTVPIPQADNNPAVTLEWRLNTDASAVFGGWNIDDVRLFTFVGVPLPPVQYRATPEQIPQIGTVSVSLQGPPTAPVVILLSDRPGPLQFLNLNLSIGPTFTAFGASFDSAGSLQFQFAGPNSPSTIGLFLHSQAVSVSGNVLIASNPMTYLVGR